jgi:hypothetical protein
MSTPYTEYGYRYPDGGYDWPDEDGDLRAPSDLDGTWATARTDRGVVDVQRLQNAATVRGDVLVSRTWSASEPEFVPIDLPTTPASVIRARVYGRGTTLVRIDTSTTDHWRETKAAGTAGFYADRDLEGAEVLFDAGATK